MNSSKTFEVSIKEPEKKSTLTISDLDRDNSRRMSVSSDFHTIKNSKTEPNSNSNISVSILIRF